MTRFLVLLAFVLQPVLAGAQERVLVIGDSILWWNQLSGNSIPQLLGTLPRYDVTNRAAPGAAFSHSGNFRSMLQREIRQQLTGGPWDIIILNGGANDLARECDCRRCDQTLSRMVSPDGRQGEVPAFLDLLRSRAARVVWMDYYPGSVRGGPFAGCTDELADYQIRMKRASDLRPWVRFVDAGDVYDPRDLSLYSRDLVHPTPKGGARIANQLARALAGR
ncbi:SGNH/GDSL hydrolase family protein [Marinovum sp.]|uniref:SGNH/GDSL hydrolase family protein n=1 Tax=Marinovum sp. TaxID=2024839 RepID=UPI002B2740DB|nr:SGNH/GDSL hydrolase family protein [Marinovum sp.]